MTMDTIAMLPVMGMLIGISEAYMSEGWEHSA